MNSRIGILTVVMLFGAFALLSGDAAFSAGDKGAKTKDKKGPSKKTTKKESTEDGKLKQLHRNLWIDTKNHWVVLEGKVSLRKGALEMFVCLKGTKEHESILSVDTKAIYVHAALIAAGAKPGKPVQFDPAYQAATGTEIEILLEWKDKDGKKHKSRAQDWIRNSKTGKAMKYSWVFGGSQTYVDEETKRSYYLAEGGELICVSNFSAALLDLPVESSASNNGLLFDAMTKKIPPLGTTVRLVLKPKHKKAAKKKPVENESSKEGPAKKD